MLTKENFVSLLIDWYLRQKKGTNDKKDDNNGNGS